MTLTTDLETLEEVALARLESTPEAVPAPEASPEEPEPDPVRLSLAALLATSAAAVMVGGVFQGAGGRVYAIGGGVLGVLLALAVRRLRRPLVVNLAAVLGLFVIGLLVVLPSGASNLPNIQSLARTAADSGGLLRPPVPLTPGWQAIIGWLMGIVGLVAAWLALVVRRPSLGLLVPLPVAAIAGISVAKNQQVGSGLVVLGLFAAALAVLSSAQTLGDEEQRLPIGYELRKTAKAALVLAPVLAILYVAAQSNVLFPRPAIDPTQRPQKPKVTPLSAVPDRVLFTVKTSQPQLPLRTGSLDIYDGTDWLLAPFSQNRLSSVASDGILDRTVAPGVEEQFTIAGLTGPVLPTPPDPVAIVAQGPRLAFDSRASEVRVAQGQVPAGLQYEMTSEALPSGDDLRRDTRPAPPSLEQFTSMPAQPPAVVKLIASVTHADKWDEWDALRLYVLDNVVATGLGTPVSMPVGRAQQILSDPQKGASPYEIVALQAMLARWVGLPARIGYGFRIDPATTDEVNGVYQIRPRDGVAFPEVYFPGFEWLPVIGDPKFARATVTPSNFQRQNASTQPSDNISVQVFLPVLTPPPSTFLAQVRRDILVALPILAVLLALYLLWPGVRKAQRHAQRRRAATAAGPRARVGLAYAEFRDLATDLGFRHQTDTPLMFLDRVAPDDDHAELAWLATRVLWGDLRDHVDDAMAKTAEELSRSLRGRLAAAQPVTLRTVAHFSRLSLRDPYAPELDAVHA